jgi:hypothetical protein
VIREVRSLGVAGPPADTQRRVEDALAAAGFHLARAEEGYLEARRGDIAFFRLVSRMRVPDTPVVVCVSFRPSSDGTDVVIAAYPDLGRFVAMGPVSRRKFRTALHEAAGIASHAAGAPRP